VKHQAVELRQKRLLLQQKALTTRSLLVLVVLLTPKALTLFLAQLLALVEVEDEEKALALDSQVAQVVVELRFLTLVALELLDRVTLEVGVQALAHTLTLLQVVVVVLAQWVMLLPITGLLMERLLVELESNLQLQELQLGMQLAEAALVFTLVSVQMELAGQLHLR
jgi:hypothetical protein